MRTANCLENENIVYVGELVQKTDGEWLRVPNFGRRSLNELKEVLAQIGLSTCMEVPGWPPENIEELTKNIDGVTKQFEELAKRNEHIASVETKIGEICQALSDPWPSKVVTLESPSPIIGDRDEGVRLYLRNLNMLWQLGIESRFKRKRKPAALVTAVSRLAEAQRPVI